MKKLGLFLTLVLGVMFSGCGSGAPAISVTLNMSGTQNVVAGQAVNVTATVTSDSKAAGVTWSLMGPGVLSGQTASQVTYTTPSPISANATATITATSVSDTTKSASLMINLQAVSIALTPSAAQNDEQGQTSSVTAAVSFDPSSPAKGVTWSLMGAGTLTGNTTSAVTYNAPASITATSTATVTATSVFDNTKTMALTVNLAPPPSITSTSPLPAGTVGTAYAGTTLTATGGFSPYTWTVTSAANTFPGGLTLSAAGAISGTPTAYGTFNFTVQVKDANNVTASSSFSMVIHPAPLVVTTNSLPNGVVNSPGYSATLTSTGGATPITWSWTAQAGSTLPPGLLLAPATGVISGTPTSAGTFNVTVTATDSSTPALTASKNLSIMVIPQLVITTNSPLPNGITNTAYTGVTLASTGGFGAVVWSLTGGTTLPPGLTLNGGTGAITGTPTTAGITNFTVQAADSGTPQQKVTKSFSITIIQQLVITTNPALPTGSVTTPYNVALASSGGTGAVTWALASGSTLPGGLTLTAAGLLSGTPTTAGTYNFSITATDSGTPPQTATVAFTLTITPKLAITTTSLPSGTAGTAYSTTVMTNNGGIAPLTWSWLAQAGSSLPPGLNIASGTGVISGKPTSAGTFNVTVTVSDSSTPAAQTASANFSISIATAPLSVATTNLPNGVVGQAYNTTLQSAGGNPPVTWSISSGSLPTWASLNASTGAITGTPPNTTGSPFNFTVKATDSSTPTAQTATQALSITVVAALSITTTSPLPPATGGSNYSTSVAATGGTTPYTWSWAPQAGSSLPPGLNINSSNGTISGTPSSQGTFNITVTVMDSTSPQQTASANFSITITVATLMVTSTSGSLPAGTINTAYPNTQLNATGGIPSYTWAITSGSLPTGMNPLSSSGQISGTPTASGTFNFTVQVTDSATPTANTATANLSITVSSDPCSSITGGAESMLSGPAAFLLKGFDNGTTPEPALVGGVLNFSGTNGSGTVTGTVDMNLNGTHGILTLTVSSGTYKINTGTDHRGCMALNMSDGSKQHYRFALANISGGVASTGHMINFDSTGPFVAGILRKQTTPLPTSVSGNFVFGFSSANNTAKGGGKFAAAGFLGFSSNGTINSGGEVDTNSTTSSGTKLNAGSCTNGSFASPCTPISITGGTYGPLTNGRGPVTINLSAAGQSTSTSAMIYAVSSSEALILGADDQTANDAYAGTALARSGSFSNSTLTGNYVVYNSGINGTSSTASGGSSGSNTLIGLFAVSSSGNGQFFAWQNNPGSTPQVSRQPATGTQAITYTIDSNGRMVLTSGGGNHPPVFYLKDATAAYFLDSGGSASSGAVEKQTSTSASGTYAFGTIDPQAALVSGTSVNGVSDGEGVVTFSAGTISGKNDNNSFGSQKPDQTVGPATFSVDNTGFGQVPGTASCSPGSATPCQFIFFVISSTRAVGMDDSSGSSPAVQTVDQ